MQNYFQLTMTPQQVDAMSALGLAHVGDAVFELLVRSRLCCQGLRRVDHLHKATVSFVAAPAQAALAARLLPHLTQWETALFKRGRNTRVHGVPKNASHAQYAKATGLEALLGGLYLTGSLDRINELFALMMEEPNAL